MAGSAGGQRRAAGGRRYGGRPSPATAEDTDTPPSDPAEVARLICLKMLAGAPRTRAQLAAALDRRGIEPEVADTVLGRFSDVGLIDDEAFARAWVQSRHLGRGLARRALAAELRQRGVEDTAVRDAVGQLDQDTELKTARALVARRLAGTRGLEPAVRMRRLAGMLARKGYSAGVAYRVVREALEEDGADVAGAVEEQLIEG